MAASIFRQICYTNKNFLTAGIIVAGYSDGEGPAVYSIPLGGSIHKQKLALGGSGSQYIYGYCDANFRENMPRNEAVEFAKNGNVLVLKNHSQIILTIFQLLPLLCLEIILLVVLFVLLLLLLPTSNASWSPAISYPLFISKCDLDPQYTPKS